MLNTSIQIMRTLDSDSGSLFYIGDIYITYVLTMSCNFDFVLNYILETDKPCFCRESVPIEDSAVLSNFCVFAALYT